MQTAPVFNSTMVKEGLSEGKQILEGGEGVWCIVGEKHPKQQEESTQKYRNMPELFKERQRVYSELREQGGEKVVDVDSGVPV